MKKKSDNLMPPKTKTDVRKTYESHDIIGFSDQKKLASFTPSLDLKSHISVNEKMKTVHMPTIMGDTDTITYDLDFGFVSSGPYIPGMDDNGDGRISSLGSFLKLLPKKVSEMTDAEKAKNSRKFKLIEALENMDDWIIDYVKNNGYSPKFGESPPPQEIRDKFQEDMLGWMALASIKDFESSFKRTVIYDVFTKEEVKARIAKGENISLTMIGKVNKDSIPKMKHKMWDSNKTGAESKARRKEEDAKNGVPPSGLYFGNKDEPHIFMNNDGKQIITKIRDCRNPSSSYPLIKEWSQFKDFLVYEKGNSKSGTKTYFEIDSKNKTLTPTLIFQKGASSYVYKVKEVDVFLKKETTQNREMTAEQRKTITNDYDAYLKETLSEEEYEQRLILQQQIASGQISVDGTEGTYEPHDGTYEGGNQEYNTRVSNMEQYVDENYQQIYGSDPVEGIANDNEDGTGYTPDSPTSAEMLAASAPSSNKRKATETPISPPPLKKPKLLPKKT